MIVGGKIRICYDSRILDEYTGVLERPKFRISPIESTKLLDLIRAAGEIINTTPQPLQLSDPSDIPFLEVAFAAQADCLITGNLKHFPLSCRQGMRVLSPAEFLDYYRARQRRTGGSVKCPSDEYGVSERIGNKRAHATSLRNVHPTSFEEFTNRFDESRGLSDVDWIPEEVEKVIHSIRKGKALRGQVKGRKAPAIGSSYK